MKKMRKFLLLVYCIQIGLLGAETPAGNGNWSAGARFQKAVGFYWINGLSVEYKSGQIVHEKISLGFNVLNSRLGSAMFNKGISYTEWQFSGIRYFRDRKRLHPIGRLNLGFAHANYGSDIFKNLAQNSMLLSLETGLAYDWKKFGKFSVGGGYNVITGSGVKGLGTQFPLYIQISALYQIKNR